MNKLILLTIALALTPNVYAEYDSRGILIPVDRDAYYYGCYGLLITEKNSDYSEDDITIKTCKDLKKGDILPRITAELAAIYCDPERPIVRDTDTNAEHMINGYDWAKYTYYCTYNGKQFRTLKAINK